MVVVAAALRDAQGQVLIAERPAGKHMAGRWEFPGGKLAVGELPADGLRRELREELGIEVGEARHVMTLDHTYPDRELRLMFFTAHEFTGTPRGLDGQRLRWVAVTALQDADILEADLPFIQALQHAASTTTSS